MTSTIGFSRSACESEDGEHVRGASGRRNATAKRYYSGNAVGTNVALISAFVRRISIPTQKDVPKPLETVRHCIARTTEVGAGRPGFLPLLTVSDIL